MKRKSLLKGIFLVIFSFIAVFGKAAGADDDELDTHIVTPSAGANGTILPSTPQTVNDRSTISFTVTPNTNYHIASVTGCGGSLSGNTYTTRRIREDCTVSASFALDTHIVTPSAGANGTISPSTMQTVIHGSATAFTVTSNTNYHIASVTGCGGSLIGNIYTTAVITADCTVSASFVLDTHIVTPSAGANGTISPSTRQTVIHGSTTAFTVTPNANYHIFSVTGCGGSLIGSTYTTGAITADCTVLVIFLDIFDSDEDTLPDSWENDNFGNLAQGAEDNPDNDGWTNIEEYDYKFDPNNASPDRPVVVFPVSSAIDVILTPELQSYLYSDSEGDIHIDTNWQVSDIPFNASDFSERHLIFDNKNLGNKTQIKLDPGILKPEAVYYIRVSYQDMGGWSEWSNWTGDNQGIKFTTQKDESDQDLNGIPDDQDIVGFVDLDNDTVDDNNQDNIAAMISLVSNGTVGLKTSLGEVSFAKTENSIDLPENPAEYNFPDGVFSFRIEGLPLGGQEIELMFYLSQVFSASEKWYKYSASTGWQDYTGRITSGIGTNKITLTYKDGDFGDADGAENGVIVDPSGPGYKNSNAGEGSGGNNGGTTNPLPSVEQPISGAPQTEITGQSISGSEWSGGGMCFIENLL